MAESPRFRSHLYFRFQQAAPRMAPKKLLPILILLWNNVQSSPIEVIKATNETEVDYRLPKIYVPSSYEIHLILPEETFTNASDKFNGSAIISFTLTEATNMIKLHASHEFLNITTLVINSQDLTTDNYTVDDITDILTITLNGNLAPRVSYMLYLEFDAKLSTSDMYGFYKSSYQDENNQTKYLATTQFEPTFARRSFPCFDEPSFKATFDIYITHPNGMNVLGNTPGSVVDNSSIPIYIDRTTTTTVKFATTPVMSTYLVAYIVSEFTCTSGEDIEENVPYRICSRKETESSRNFAVEIGPPLLRSLSAFTGYNYSLAALGKMDQAAIPDFAAGAMENWGLVTYRERLLLWDEEQSSTSSRQSIATVIAHEFTHQWFGNLVTMDWWSEIFLNEGFATYFEYFTTHEVLPDWQLDKQFVVQVHQNVLQTDSLESAQALQQNASSPSEASARFSTISYDKGGSIFRMMEHVMGPENFRAGLQNYLRAHAFSNTVPEDLWATLSASITTSLPADLTTIMENWVQKSGYPVLTVRHAGISIIVTQERFLFSGNDTETKWYVPVSYTTSVDQNKFNNTLPNDWLEPTGFLEIPYPNNAEWIILNNQETGYYRVQYDEILWNNISEALIQDNFGGIPEINRAQIVDDAFNLARANKLQYSRVFHISRFLANEIAYPTWYSAFSGFNYLVRRVGRDSVLGNAIANHVLELADTLYKTVNISRMTDEEHYYTLTSSLALTYACSYGRVECINLVLELFADFTSTNEKPPKNLKSLVYCNGLRYSTNSTDWDTLWNTYLTTEDSGEKSTILTALGCTKNETLLENYLFKSITTDSGIRTQDALSVFSAVYSGNPIGVEVALKFLIENHKAIQESYNSLNSLTNMVTGLASWITTQNQVDQLENFISTGNLSESFNLAASSAVGTAKANLAWVALFLEDLNEYYGIEEEDEATPTTTTITTTTITEPPNSGGGNGVAENIATLGFIVTSTIFSVLINY